MSDSRTTNTSGETTVRKQRRLPRQATPERLYRGALHYLERYASSAENLRAVLRRRVDRSVRLYGTDPAAAEQWIADIIARLTASGLLDDLAYAEGRALSLHRRGYSSARIAGALRQKGVADQTVAAALATLAAETPAIDLVAAIRLAQRRRLGPWRDSTLRPERRQRDLAALARAGFSFELARRVVDAETIDVLEEWLADGTAAPRY